MAMDREDNSRGHQADAGKMLLMEELYKQKNK
jgi:hypothetical protein